ncbi:MAG: hypothetical protein H7Y14_07345 [Burkholderiales bacterium]|nr:hypothetical protein [Burkholderiales bacterium]
MSENVFAPPRASLDVHEGPEALWEMPFKEVRKLYLASVNIRALGVLYALGALSLLATAGITAASPAGTAGPSPPGLIALLIALGIISVAATVSSYTRPKWGRVLGIILCGISLVSFPLGTLIGILGIIAYVQGGKLFGPDRLHHKDVALVYKQRKKDKR